MDDVHYMVPGEEREGVQVFECSGSTPCGRRVLIDSKRRRREVLARGDDRVDHHFAFPGVTIEASIVTP
ncbi:MAG: hypothetical protein GY939_26855 [Actinomycetia bacterium]|nr:hypothetical protein [Actinomycetes bacterium]